MRNFRRVCTVGSVIMLKILVPMIAVSLIASTAVCGDTPVRRRAADLLILQNQTRLFGLLVARPPDQPALLLVRRSWWNQHAAALPELSFDQTEAQASRDARWLRQHIQQQKNKPNAEAERTFYLHECLSVLQPDDHHKSPATVLLLQIDRTEIGRMLQKSIAAKRLTLAALCSNCPVTETATPIQLQRWLAAKKQTTEDATASFAAALQKALKSDNQHQPSRQLQAMLYQADRQSERTLRLLQLGERYLPLSENLPPEKFATLVTDLLQQQLQQQLSSLLNETAGPSQATPKTVSQQLPAVLPAALQQQAADAKAPIVELNSMTLNPTQGTASVSLAVFHHSPFHNTWTRLAAATGTASQQQMAQGTQQQIQNDPRVQQVTQLFRQLGINAQQLNQATSMGAVVQMAQQQARSRLAKRLNPAELLRETPSIVRAVLSQRPTAD